MRLTLLAALISATLASHASAQISAGPLGPLNFLSAWISERSRSV